MSLFISIHFALPAEDNDGTILNLITASLADEVKEILQSPPRPPNRRRESKSNSFRWQRITERNWRTLVGKIAFLVFPSRTSSSCYSPITIVVTRVAPWRVFVNRKSIYFLFSCLLALAFFICLNDVVPFSFSILTLLAPSGDCDELDLLQNLSAHAELEEMLHQSTERRCSIFIMVFIKDRQETLDDVIVMLVNLVLIGRYGSHTTYRSCRCTLTSSVNFPS